jgi:hypothetical protein
MRHNTYILLDPHEQLPAVLLHGTHAALAPILRAHNDALGYGVFETVNVFDGQGRKTANLQKLCALYADFDRGVPQACPLQPTRRVESSPGKEQWYWELDEPLLATPENTQEYLGILSSLVRTLEADENAKDLTRVLRTVGYKNTKYDTLPVVREITNTARRYDLCTLRRAFGYEEQPELTGNPRALTAGGEGRALQAFRKGLLEHPPPPPGQGGTNGWLYRAASWGIGTLGLELDDVIDALLDLNIEHVWRIQDAEIVHVTRNADRYARRLTKTPAVIKVDL